MGENTCLGLTAPKLFKSSDFLMKKTLDDKENMDRDRSAERFMVISTQPGSRPWDNLLSWRATYLGFHDALRKLALGTILRCSRAAMGNGEGLNPHHELRNSNQKRMSKIRIICKNKELILQAFKAPFHLIGHL